MTSFTRRAALVCLALAFAGGALAAPAKVPRKLSILILDDLVPLSPHQTRYALSRGHSVTVYNRFRPEGLPTAAEFIEGSRYRQFEALGDRTWDVILDNGAGNQRRWVRGAAEHLGWAKHYVFYTDGVGKVEGEIVDHFGDRATIVRAGALAGTGDFSDRFTYWAVRVAAGGEVLVPGDPDGDAAFIDVRDVAEWMVRLAEQQKSGIYDAISTVTMKQMLDGIRTTTNSTATFVWVPASFVEERNVRLPVWTTTKHDTKPAIARGLTYRPLEDTIRTTLQWYLRRDGNGPAIVRSTITPDAEARLIAEWKALQPK